MISWNNPYRSPIAGIQNRVFYSALLEDWVGVNLFLPEGYREGAARYPAIYWLHGEGGDERSGLFLASFLRSALAEENIPPLIMVFPNLGPWAGNSRLRRRGALVERYFVEELLPFVDGNYRTLAAREGRSVEGVGGGGSTALRLALGHAELFSSASAFDARPARRGLRPRSFPAGSRRGDRIPALRLVVPDRDAGASRFADRFLVALARRGLSAEREDLAGFGPDPETYYDSMGHAAFGFHLRSLACSAYSYELVAGPQGSVLHRNLEFSRAGGRPLLLDLYLPCAADGPLPVVAFIFGGAFRVGSKRDCMATRLVADGFAVASISYRLSAEAAFPAQLEDCKAAIRWLRAKAARFGLDPCRIGVWGMSAGAYLAVMLGVTGEEPAPEGEDRGVSSSVQAVCDFYGPSDFLRMDSRLGSFSHDAPQSAESRLLRGPIQGRRELARAASPLGRIGAGRGLPPFLIVHDPKDMYVPFEQSELLLRALRSAGAEARLVEARESAYPFHGFDDSGEGRRELRAAVDAFFSRHLKGAR